MDLQKDGTERDIPKECVSADVGPRDYVIRQGVTIEGEETKGDVTKVLSTAEEVIRNIAPCLGYMLTTSSVMKEVKVMVM